MNSVLQKLRDLNAGNTQMAPTGQSKTTNTKPDASSILQLLRDRKLGIMFEIEYGQKQGISIFNSDIPFWRSASTILNYYANTDVDTMKEWLKKNSFDEDFSKWADKDKMLFKLRWC